MGMMVAPKGVKEWEDSLGRTYGGTCGGMNITDMHQEPIPR